MIQRASRAGCRIDERISQVNPQPLQVPRERTQDADQAWIVIKQIDAQRRAARPAHALPVLNGVTSRAQQPVSLGKSRAPRGQAIPQPWIWRIEQPRRQGIDEWLQQASFSIGGRSAGCERAIAEEALDRLHQTVHQIVVGPVEVVSKADRLTHPPVIEWRAAQIEYQRRDFPCGPGLDHVALDPALAQRRPIIAARPLRRCLLKAQIEVVRAERLQRDVIVAVIGDADPVEVEAPAIYRQVGGPIVRIARQHDRTARIDLFNAIRTGAKRWCKPHARQVAHLPEVPRLNGQRPKDAHHIAPRRAFRREADLAWPCHAHAIVPQRLLVKRRPLVAQRLEGEGDVLGHHRLAVAPARLWAQLEGQAHAVFAHSNGLGQQPVISCRLIPAAHEQRVENQLAQQRRNAPRIQQRIERIERPCHAEPEHAALWRARVGVIEMPEAGAVFQLMHRGITVPRFQRAGGNAREEECDGDAAV